MLGGERPEIRLLLLDGDLPESDTLDVCRRIGRASGGATPILFLAAGDGEAEAVWALRAAADDHVSRPFSADLLTACIRASLRRYTADRM